MAIQKRCNAGKPATWEEIVVRVDNDPKYPEDRRPTDSARLKKALSWDAAPTRNAAKSSVKRSSDFENRPFNRQTINELFAKVRPRELGISAKTVANTKSICMKVADFYNMPRGIAYTPLSEDCENLLGLVKSDWDRRALMTGLRYFSFHNISPWRITQADADDYRRALVEDFHRADAKELWVEFTRVWEKCHSVRGWPDIALTRNICPRQAAINWADYPGLNEQVDAYLNAGRCSFNDNNDGEADAVPDFLIDPLKPISIRNLKGSIGMVVWALGTAGIPKHELTSLQSLCRPERFSLAMRILVGRTNGAVNRTIMARATALYRLARHPGLLPLDDVKTVQNLMKRLSRSFRRFLETHTDKDQQMLDRLDDPSVMDALLQLPTEIKNRVLAKRRPPTIGDAYAIQRAVILELWLCAPYRIGAFSSIGLEQLVSIRIQNVETVLLRGPKEQSSNKKSPEHLLNSDTISLLNLYLDHYRPLIAEHNGSPNSDHLLPGMNGRSKHPTSLRTQMTKFIRKHTSLQNWHPHAMRKIVPKIALDGDPGAVEIVRRTGGWADDRMLRDVYGQHVHRASQKQYLKLLEERRLTSIRSLAPRQRKRAKAR